MAMDNQVLVSTNASEADVVKAFKTAFFTAPTLADHFKPTPAAHFRSQMTWRPAQVRRRGQLDGYKVPPGAPPGWPFLK